MTGIIPDVVPHDNPLRLFYAINFIQGNRPGFTGKAECTYTLAGLGVPLKPTSATKYICSDCLECTGTAASDCLRGFKPLAGLDPCGAA